MECPPHRYTPVVGCYMDPRSLEGGDAAGGSCPPAHNQSCFEASERVADDDIAIFEAHIKRSHIDYGYLILEAGIIETALRKTTVEWHLATLEAWPDATARTGLLTLVATA